MNNEAARYNKNYNDLMYADLTFDLGEVKEFAQLNISTLVNLANGIARPSRLQILTSNDEGATKEWEIIYDAPMAVSYTHLDVYKRQGNWKAQL